MASRRYRKRLRSSQLRKKQCVFLNCLVLYMVYYWYYYEEPFVKSDWDSMKLQYVSHSFEGKEETQQSGCEVPKLDPFAPEVMKFHKKLKPIRCTKSTWVTCYLSECRPTKEIIHSVQDLECTYYDIVYVNDEDYGYHKGITLKGNHVYNLVNSDFVQIICTGYTSNITRMLIGRLSWTGFGSGLRSNITTISPPPGMEDNHDVLILAFDSTSKNGFIRKMPISYKYITKTLGATVLNKYNIVGDATAAAMFPILSGKRDTEMPESRRDYDDSFHLDEEEFLFYRMKQIGYRTVYYEDMPWMGTFQLKHNGFSLQPSDHYLRALFKSEADTLSEKTCNNWKCFGGVPRFKFMMDLNEQFFNLDVKHFSFTFFADITHDDFNYIDNADKPLAEFLERMDKKGTFQNTLLIVMGDHGPRFEDVRDTYQGMVEERLPLMAIRLPDRLRARRPGAQKSLESNAEVLTTPHDIHSTILDVVNMSPYWNFYKVQGSEMLRALTLLQPIPSNRSCSDADIEPHWCICTHWEEVANTSPMYKRVAQALVDYINELTQSLRNICALRTLQSIQWVVTHKVNSEVLNYGSVYQVKIIVGPAKGVYEGAVTYIAKQDGFTVSSSQISRVNAYKDEPKCIKSAHPHLMKYCYCNSS